MSTAQSPADALRRVRKALESQVRDLDSMPFFVRPMVKRGFAKRTGMSFDGWQRRIGEAITWVETKGEVPQGLVADLERLAENFRTAPERAKRGMRGAGLDRVVERSREREEAVRAAIETVKSHGSAPPSR